MTTQKCLSKFSKKTRTSCSKVYECKNCNKCIDRDINASKNILMKGILSL